MTRFRALHPLTRALLLLAVVNTVLVNLAFAALGYNTTLHHMSAYLIGSAHSDSWEPMRQALAFTRQSDPASLYQSLFFDRQVDFIYPPSSLLLLQLAGLVSGQPLPSDTVLNVVSWAAVLCTALASSALLRAAVRRFAPDALEGRDNGWLLALVGVFLAFGFYPIVKAFTLGQVQTISTMLFTLSTLAWVRDRRALAGACSGLICLVKPQLGLLFVWGLLRRERSFVAGWLAAVVPLMAVSLLLFGLPAHLEYLRLASFITGHSWSFHANQSVSGLLNRALFNGVNLAWDPHYAPFNAWVYAGTIGSAMALIGFALFWRPSGHARAPLVDFFIASLSFTMASPVAWEHHYGVMLPIFACVLPAAVASMTSGLKTRRYVGDAGDAGGVGDVGARGVGARVAVPAGLLAAYLLSANLLEFTGVFAGSLLNLVQSYLLVGALVLLARLYALRGAPAGAW